MIRVVIAKIAWALVRFVLKSNPFFKNVKDYKVNPI
jgi:hypothetical protein